MIAILTFMNLTFEIMSVNKLMKTNLFNMNWTKIEEIIGEPLPSCIKKILSNCAYDTFVSLKNISEESVNEIEFHINSESRALVQELDCCHSDYYKKQDRFKLLPGHRDLIISLSKISLSASQRMYSFLAQNSDLPCILKEMVANVIENAERDCPRYSDTIRWFSTYIFLLSGRACYEVLSKNISLPSIKTICECIIF